ncbi:MAG: succinate dehydrogenase cytochrome b558 subunit [Planctomycetota bacterium]|nr:succinate dehydrogenase cytochrome b558 subunit [Planctomycetota bacterium]
MAEVPPTPFLARHEFLIRRLHSLSGLVPVGAYMVVHLLTNASVLAGPEVFQKNVYAIHSLGPLLPLVEWGFIFIPILFHAIIGVVIVAGGLPNTANYPYSGNVRYALQRATGMIAFVFIAWHVFHMHGWFHADWWLQYLAEPLGGARFRPYNAASSTALALQSSIVVALYAIGITACVYHLANGIWTMGITWGVWTSPRAQRRAGWLCGLVGIAILAVGMAALLGMSNVDQQQALDKEDQMYEGRVELLDVPESPEKRYSPAERKEVAADKPQAVVTGAASTSP